MKKRFLLLIILGLLSLSAYTYASCIDPCTASEAGKKKCNTGWTAIGSVDEIKECKYYAPGNCYGYERVQNCKGTGLSCSEKNGVFGCNCATPCTAGQKRCLERNSLPISPAGPDEIQQCNNDGCGWTTTQSCTMNQDCVNEQCVDKQCPYCCPASKTCSVPDYGQGCTTGTCCKSETYCQTPTTPPTTPPSTQPPTTTPTTPPAIPPTETISTSELKNLLIEIIKDYFTADTPKLTVPEIKDFITAYLSAQTNNIDLSQTGTYSGKKLIEIYNKAKETTPPITPPQGCSTCSSLGKQCGYWPDGCGGVLDCSVCQQGGCDDGRCIPAIQLPWNQKVTDQLGIIPFASGETKTFFVRNSKNIAGFSIRTYGTLMPTGIDYTFSFPNKPDGTDYKLITGTDKWSGASNGYITWRFWSQVKPSSFTTTVYEDYIYPGDFMFNFTMQPLPNPEYYPQDYKGYLQITTEIFELPEGYDTPLNAIRLDQQGYGETNYGTGLEPYHMTAGQTATFILPVGEVVARSDYAYSKPPFNLINPNIGKLNFHTTSSPEGNGEIEVTLKSPTGEVWGPARSLTSDSSFNIYSQSYSAQSYINYPHQYISKGDWIVEIKAHKASSFIIWWFPTPEGWY